MVQTRALREPAIVDSHTSVGSLLAAQQRREQMQFGLILGIGLVLGLALTLAGLRFGFALAFGLLAVVVTFALIARWPLVGLYVVVICALVVDWVPLPVHIGTDQLPIWSWPAGFPSLPERPIGVVLLFILGVMLVQRLAQREQGLRGGALLWPFLLFLGTIAIAFVHGLASGGSFQSAWLEIRPFEYLFLSYLIAYNLITRKQHVRLFFWLVIAGAAVKAFQGVYIVFTTQDGHITAGQNEIMGHEDSFFFVGVLLLIILFRLHYTYRPQLIAAIAILPPLVISLLANNRRADYVALAVGVGVVWVLTIVVKPEGRRGRIYALLLCAALGTAYVFAFAHSSGWYASPAHAVMSAIHPSAADTRDTGSNEYRIIEDFDLKFTERQSPLLGYGFGKQFLQPVPLANIAGLDPIYLYVPHNTIYWVWMRAGPLGFFALWLLLGSIIIRGTIIARGLRDHYLQTVAIYIVAITVMEVLIASADYQLFFFRTVIYTGLLAGMLMKLPTLEGQDMPPAPDLLETPDKRPPRRIVLARAMDSADAVGERGGAW